MRSEGFLAAFTYNLLRAAYLCTEPLSGVVAEKPASSIPVQSTRRPQSDSDFFNSPLQPVFTHPGYGPGTAQSGGT